jgi:hypothetical protein
VRKRAGDVPRGPGLTRAPGGGHTGVAGDSSSETGTPSIAPGTHSSEIAPRTGLGGGAACATCCPALSCAADGPRALNTPAVVGRRALEHGKGIVLGEGRAGRGGRRWQAEGPGDGEASRVETLVARSIQHFSPFYPRTQGRIARRRPRRARRARRGGGQSGQRALHPTPRMHPVLSTPTAALFWLVRISLASSFQVFKLRVWPLGKLWPRHTDDDESGSMDRVFVCRVLTSLYHLPSIFDSCRAIPSASRHSQYKCRTGAQKARQWTHHVRNTRLRPNSSPHHPSSNVHGRVSGRMARVTRRWELKSHYISHKRSSGATYSIGEWALSLNLAIAGATPERHREQGNVLLLGRPNHRNSLLSSQSVRRETGTVRGQMLREMCP